MWFHTAHEEPESLILRPEDKHDSLLRGGLDDIDFYIEKRNRFIYLNFFFLECHAFFLFIFTLLFRIQDFPNICSSSSFHPSS